MGNESDGKIREINLPIKRRRKIKTGNEIEKIRQISHRTKRVVRH